MKLKSKILFLSIGTLSLMSILVVIVMAYFVGKLNVDNGEVLKDLIYEDYDSLLKSQVENVESFLFYKSELVDKGIITEEEAKEEASDVIRALRYDEDGFFSIDTKEGESVVFSDRLLEGTNRLNLKDENGLYYINELIETVNLDGAGYLDYWIAKEEGGEAFPKRAYAKSFEPFNWIISTSNYVDSLQLQLDQNKEINLRTIKITQQSLLVVIFFALIVSSIVMYIFGSKLSKPFASITKSLNKISGGQGDLTQLIKIESKDEAGELAGSFNDFSNYLRKTINVLKKSNNGLKDTGLDLSSNMEETASSVNQISTNINSVMGQVDDQMANVEETSATVEQTTQNIKSLNEMINNLYNSVKNIGEGINNITRTIEQQNLIIGKSVSESESLFSHTASGKETMETVLDTLGLIEERTGRLLEANEFIKNIASQTGLLAMNAAIEAAHAGEAGKGFAVVADEINRMASQSSLQSKSIEDDINDITDRIQMVFNQAQGMNEEFDSVVTGVKNLNKEIDSLEEFRINQENTVVEINEKIEILDEISLSVNSGSDEMTLANEQIIKSVSNLNQITHIINSAIKEIDLGTNEINKSIQNVRNLSGVNKKNIEQVDLYLKNFTT